MPPIDKHIKVSMERTGILRKRLKDTILQRYMNMGRRLKKNMGKRHFRNISSIYTMM